VSGTRNGSVEITTDDQTFTCSAGDILPNFCNDGDDDTTTSSTSTSTTTTSTPNNNVIPTTPSPTNPLSVLQCDSTLNGVYNGDLVVVDVYIPFDGDMTFYAQIFGDSNVPRVLLIRDINGVIIAADGDSSDPDGVSNGIRTIEVFNA